MEICQSDFYKKLLVILEDISNATFIALDLEMSGISTRPKNSAGDRSHDVAKPTLQQQYDEIRSTAETYQILQMGITVVEEVREKDFYIARPYNFNLSPLSYGGIDIGIQRTIRFDFGRVFQSGVTYLSRSEESEIRLEHEQRAVKNSKIPDLIIESDDRRTLEFCDFTRTTINNWLEKSEQNFVKIGTKDDKLTGFQRRLIYQIVRKEFPDLTTYGRSDGDFMQIEKLDILKEEISKKNRLLKLNSKISKQKGLGWVFESLCGGSISGIDPLWFYNENDDEPDKLPHGISIRIKNLEMKLRSKKQVIVGHNPFMDLAFFYKTFVGPLPSHIEKFQVELHKMFPRVIDTKYLATHGLESMFVRSSLKEVLKPFLKVYNPLILLHQDHRDYGSSYGKDHEAGYDSWMTAELFVKLSAKLMTEQEKLRDNGQEEPCEEVPNYVRQKSNDSSKTPSSSLLSQQNHHFTCNSNPLKFTNSFAVLESIEAEEDTTMTDVSINHLWLPDFEDSFWIPYMNKLRVNSIEGGVFDLTGSDSAKEDDPLKKKMRMYPHTQDESEV